MAVIFRLGLFLVLALGLFGFGAVAWVTLNPHQQGMGQSAIAAPAEVQVVVAAQSLRSGSLLKSGDLTIAKLAPSIVPETAIKAGTLNMDDLKGAMIRRGLRQGEALLNGDVIHPTDRGFLAAVLQPGMRAITVAVDVVTGAAGLISPGDHVDVMLIQTLDDASRPPGQRVAAHVVLNDIRVIAIDQKLVAPEGPDSGGKPAATVTLEVAGDQAERVVVAGRIGRLSLVVRSAEPGGVEAASDHVTWGGDVSPALEHAAPSTANRTIRVYRGDADAKEFRF